MSYFYDLLNGGNEDADTLAPPEDAPNPRVSLGAPAAIQSQAIQNVEPQTEGHTIQGFASNFAKDAGKFAGGLGAMLGEVAFHPIESAEAVGGAIAHPIDTAEKLAQPIIDRYTPQPGESIPGMLVRNAYEHPFDTLMDASTIVQGPFGAAAKVADVAGAANLAGKLRYVADAAKFADPITIAQKTGRAIMKTYAPDAYALTTTLRANTDKLAEEATRQKYLEDDFAQRATEAAAHLNPAEQAIKFAWGEGRVPIINNDQITEITHRGALESRKVQEGIAIRPEALQQWKDAYEPLQQEFERAAGLDPESFAEKARASAVRKEMYGEDGISLNPDFNPFDPAAHEAGQAAYDTAFQDASERQQRRRAVSTMTALDVAKEKDFRARAAQFGIDDSKFTELQKATGIPNPWGEPTLDEAMQLMPNGGMIIPHSMEVMNREQSTVRNVLTKAQEASAWKQNTGAMFRSGMLDQLDPTAALARAYRMAIRGDTFAKIADDTAQVGLKEGFAEVMPKGWNPAMDPDVRAGTHQPLHPGSISLDGTVGEHFERLKSRLMEVAPYDQAAGDVNLVDVAENMGAAAHQTFPLANEGGPVYKIRTGAGDALALFKKSFEPATNPFAKISDKWVMQPFNLMTLNMKGGRILNNGIGNTGFVAMEGLHPFSARGLMSMLTAGRATLGHFGFLKDETSQDLAKVFELPGVSGGVGASEALQSTNELAGRLAESTNPLARGVGKWAGMMATANQNLENIYRAGSTIYEMTPGGMDAVKGLIHGAATMADMGDRFSELRGMGVGAISEADLKGAVDGMNRWLNDYSRTSALDRLTGRYVFPYHKFYRHSAELLMRAPFEKPIKMQLARRIGAAALNDVKDQMASYGYDWNTQVPEGMRDSIPVGHMKDPNGNDSMVVMNTSGPNPFSFFNMNGDIGGSMVDSLNPLAKIAIEQATGVNLFTREKFQGALSTFNGRKVDPETGAITEDYERPSLVEHYLRQFWPYQTLRELVADGRQPRDGADLIDMATNRAGTYRLDDMGRPQVKPRPAGALTPFQRVIGPVASVVQPPTQGQEQANDATVSEEFTNLYQQHPELREQLIAQLRLAAGKYKPPERRVRPRV